MRRHCFLSGSNVLVWHMDSQMQTFFPFSIFDDKILTLAQLNCARGGFMRLVTEVGHKFSWVSAVSQYKDRQQR